MWLWFCIEGVTAEELIAFGKEKGVKVEFTEKGAHLCVGVVLMGWSWAP